MSTERELFEAQASLTDAEIIALAPMAGNFSQEEVEAFCAGFRRCAKLAAKPTPSTEVVLPELPEPTVNVGSPQFWRGFSHEQMHAFARSAIALNRGEDARDAARYRWLRKYRDLFLLTGFFGDVGKALDISKVDAAIDKAMGGKGVER